MSPRTPTRGDYRRMHDRLRNAEAQAALAARARSGALIPPTAADDLRADVVTAIADGDPALAQFADEAARSGLPGSASAARAALQAQPRKEEGVIRFVGNRDLPPASPAAAAEQQDAVARLEVERRRAEQELHESEAEAEELRRLRGGALTQRQEAATTYAAYVRSLTQGSWRPTNESWATDGSVQDDGRALQLAVAAAADGVKVALQPLLAEAEAEVASADAERLEIIRRGHL